jgi:branched-subunit amino acid aminotransferase/4-amino-4-deoxychorismate lyase
MSVARLTINGEPAHVDDLRVPVATNYGHFTSMRVACGCVRGLDLHLQRLDASTRLLFDSALDTDAVRNWLRAAIDGDDADQSVRINVFSRAYNRDRPADAAKPDVLISVSAALSVSTQPLRVKSFVYERDVPQVKHVGTFPLFHHRRLAQQGGFDDALFVDRNENVSEGSIWNVAFFDGERIVWPNSPQLEGVSKQLLKRGFAQRGVESIDASVPLSRIGDFRAAFFTNSGQPVRFIERIDDAAFACDDGLGVLLAACYDCNPPQRI